jgi:drug/metabolite transporter (DMT)-like permease
MSDVSPLWTALIRLVAGTVIALLTWQTHGYFESKASISWSYRLLGVISLTAFGSTYLGIWLQQISLKFAPAGIAQTLSSTSPLFVLPMAYCLGENMTRRSIIGVLLAIIGVGVLFLD